MTEPWNGPNADGELPGGICCQRATGRRCYDHTPPALRVQYESNVTVRPEILRELQEGERGPFMISAKGNVLTLRFVSLRGAPEP